MQGRALDLCESVPTHLNVRSSNLELQRQVFTIDVNKLTLINLSDIYGLVDLRLCHILMHVIDDI